MTEIAGAFDHPFRRPLVDELHSRPFPVIDAPAEAHFIALRPAHRSDRDRAAEHAQLARLLAGHDIAPPEPGTSHWVGKIGPWMLKWESHSEFVTYLLWAPDDGPAFSGPSPFSADWLENGAGRVLASARLRIEREDDDDRIATLCDTWFRTDSLAVSRVLDQALVIAGDFRTDSDGTMRFGLFAAPSTGPNRVGRVVQRVCEIETYRALAMFGLARARELAPDLADLEATLGGISEQMTARSAAPAETLDALLELGGRIERISSRSAFRFSASAAYEAIVSQRIAILREIRFRGRQTFGEFMTRRFDPAMRTVASTEHRLHRLSDRTMRIGELLRTRVEVERSGENRALLESLDRRSDQALRLQHTVEGLSVVAISYYATGLALYVAAPISERFGLSKGWTAAALVPLIILGAWLALRRIRARLH